MKPSQIGRTFAAASVALILVLAPLAAALTQVWSGYPHIFFTNALDEGSYLQYDQSRFVSTHMVRPSQYLVTILHDRGFSGGMINALFDFLFPSVTWALICYCLTYFGHSKRRAALIALALYLSSMLFVRTNPVFDWIFHEVVNSGMVSWITTPAAAFAPGIRTPEPQSTYLIMAAATALALRLRSFFPVFAIFPLLYSFVALPFSFVVLAGFLATRKTLRKIGVKKIALIAALFLSVGLGLYYHLFLGDYAKHLSLQSRLPLVSVTGIMTLLLYYFGTSSLSVENRRYALLLAVSPWVAANHQIVSGFLAQPSNAESYFGASAAGGLLVISLLKREWLLRVLTTSCVAMYILSSIVWWKDNLYPFGSESISSELTSALRDSSDSVAVTDPLLATRLNLLFPEQKPTVLSVNRVYIGVNRESLDRYVCAKQSIIAQGFEDQFKSIFSFLDSAYRDDFEDPLLNLRRITSPRANNDVTTYRSDCSRFSEVKIFTADKKWK